MLKLYPLDILGFKFTRRTKILLEMTIQNGGTNISLDYVGLKKLAHLFYQLHGHHLAPS